MINTFHLFIKMKRVLILLTACVMASVASAFSPYENYLQSGRTTVVGLIAQVDPEKKTSLLESIEALNNDTARRPLAASGIENVSAYTRQIGEHEWIVLNFLYDGNKDYLQAANDFEASCEEAANLAAFTLPHPRAERFGTHWLQMEWITYIRGMDVPGSAMNQIMIVTTVRPEKEQEYRTLHQTVWPGVVDQVKRSRNRNLAIFLTEIDDWLVEFLYLEYVGDTPQSDDEMSQTDAINHRWWKITDQCQKPLPGAPKIWDPMTPLN